MLLLLLLVLERSCGETAICVFHPTYFFSPRLNNFALFYHLARSKRKRERERDKYILLNT